MKKLGERGQIELGIGLIVATVLLAWAFMAMAANQPNMQRGAETIGNGVGNAIDNIAVQEPAFDETYMSWKGSQTLFPNEHSLKEHGDDARRTVDCYNRNGAFHVMKLSDGEFHLLCRDDDGGTRDIMLKREGNSNRFIFKNAFSPKLETGNIWSDIQNWLARKGATKGTMPNDAVIIIDGIIP